MELLAVQERGGRVEVEHHGDAVVVRADGSTLAWGDASFATYWRSAAKPVQAAAMVAAGAADAYGLADAVVAVACGSHAGEPMHRAAVADGLQAVGLGPSDLRCGVHRPWSRHSVRPGDGPDPLGNNCSGKHMLMLAACMHRGWDLAYLEVAHPAQQAVAARIAHGLERRLPHAVDGCGVPTFWGSLRDLARCFQDLQHDAAGRRILAAMAKHPEMLAGTDKFCTDLARVTKGRVLGKYGALGVYAALDTRTGDAVAVKLRSGHERATKATVGRLLVLEQWLTPGEAAALDGHLHVPERNHVGIEVGGLQSVLKAR